jgi:spore coat polysaccharide biosynthesis protein SpsF (cytidylyltransferase family)
MQLNNQDMAIIEQALREAINQGADYHKVSTYQSVLGKLQEISHADAFAQTTMRAEADGFRYDYDDSAETV